jgi:hypothetical protein
MAGLPRAIPTFTAFWPVYLGEHRRAGCRFLHYGSALTVLGLLVAGLTLRAWWPLLAVPIPSYGLAWIGHFCIEGNRPATWSYPWWSLRAEFRMARMALTGRLRAEMTRLGVPSR